MPELSEFIVPHGNRRTQQRILSIVPEGMIIYEKFHTKGKSLFGATLNNGSPLIRPHLSLSDIFLFFPFKSFEFAAQEAMIFIDISSDRIHHKLLVYFLG